MATIKTRVHNEWFRPVTLGNRKSCPTCNAKLPPGESIWSWGEYHVGKWRTVKHFCVNCYLGEVQRPMLMHRIDCGCEFAIKMYHSVQPHWLRFEIAKVDDHIKAVVPSIFGRMTIFGQVMAVDDEKKTVTIVDAGGTEHTFGTTWIMSVDYAHPLTLEESLANDGPYGRIM